MALINCPECGKQVSDKAPACPDCGCPINAVPSVSAPNIAEEVAKLLVLARRAREGGDTVNAKRYYDQILDKAPGNWEGVFYSVYYDATMCKIMGIASAANSVANCIFSTFSAISDLNDDNEKENALNDVVRSATSIVALFIDSATQHYQQHSTVEGVRVEYVQWISAARNIYREVEGNFKKVFPEKKEMLANFQLQFIHFLKANSLLISGDEFERLQKEVAVVYPAYGRRLELTKEIEDLNGKIEELNRPVRSFKILYTMLAIGCFFYAAMGGGTSISLLSDDDLIGLGTFLLICGLLAALGGVAFIRKIKKEPTKAEVEEKNRTNSEEKEELIQKRDALQKELNNLSI